MRTAAWTDSVSVLDRVTAVLEAFGDDDGLGVSEIARRANLPKSTVSRLVNDLVRQRYLDREGTRLHLGLKLFELGQAVERPMRLRRLARPVMVHLRTMTGESVRLGVLDGDDVVLIAALGGSDDPAPAAQAGSRTPARDSGLGRAILAGSLASHRDDSTGLACVASPILLAGSPPVGAIGVVGPAHAIDEQRMGALVRSAATILSRLV